MSSGEVVTPTAFDVDAVRAQFPILKREIHGKPLVYLDNAATSQKPQVVIDALVDYYTNTNANVHRGVHLLSQLATEAYESARTRIARFIGTDDPSELIFVRGTTEGINLVAKTFGRAHVGEGDEIVISAIEHHSNIVPWQMLCDETGATLRVIPVDDDGVLVVDEYRAMLSERTKIVSIVHISNSLGTVNPIREMIADAHEVGAYVVIDGAQSLPHTAVDVRDLDSDFFVFSGHKMFGPTGIGGLHVKRSILEDMGPWQGGGDMIRTVTFEGSTWADAPARFEAGTPNIADAIGLGAAVDMMSAVGLDAIARHENDLLSYATERLLTLEGLRIIGTAPDKAGVVSFIFDDIHPHDVGTIVDREGVAIRTGHHCTQPVMTRFGVPATSRASFAFYNTRSEIDVLVDALNGVMELFR